MSFHVNRCAQCGTLTEGAAYYLTDAPKDMYGRIERKYGDSNPPRFCSESCRTAGDRAESKVL
jgi:hypothetical protein